MILRNIKVLTNENEELHKQIKEYKEKEIKIMRALYYINKKGISIDTFLDCNADILTSAESLNLIYNRFHKERVRPR